MWVSKTEVVETLNLSLLPLKSFLFAHNLTHRVKVLNSPLTWGYGTFPQVNGLVTTTTYRYTKTPVRFPANNFQNFNLLKIKTCNVIQLREG
jgi:hypothetical protein